MFAISFDQIHTFQYDDVEMTISREKKGEPVGTNSDASQFEMFTIKCISNQAIEKLIKDSIEFVELKKYKDDRDYVDIYVYEQRFWFHVTSQKKKEINTIHFSGDIKESILEDVDAFMNDQQLYEQHGIPYKRSYLLTGPSGTGKTSIIYAIASKFNLNIGIFNMTSENQSLEQAYKSLPKNTILLIEDIQYSFPTEHKESYNFETSELLNVLDGVFVKDKLITFMTATKIDHIPKVLLRPGRVDETYTFNFCDKKQIMDIHKKFCPNEDSEIFYKSIQKENLSLTPAILQKFLFRNIRKRNIKDLVALVNTYKEDHTTGHYM